MKNGFVLSLVFLVLLSCSSKRKIKEIGKVHVIKKIKFNKQYNFEILENYSNNIIGYSKKEDALIVLDENGNNLSYYQRIGKGPGEFMTNSPLRVFGKNKNKLYTYCKQLHKIIIFQIKKNKSINFFEEYNLKRAKLLYGTIQNDKLYTTAIFSEKILYEYDLNLNFIDSFIKRDNKLAKNMSAEQIRKYLIQSTWVVHVKNDKVVLINKMNNEFRIYEEKKHKFLLKVSKNLCSDKPKSYKSKSFQNREKKKVIVQSSGYLNSKISGDKVFIAYSPEDLFISYIDVYNLSGDYLGRYIIENSKRFSIKSCYFTSNQKMYFVRKYENNKKHSNILFEFKLLKN